jgi:hypothetical protein
MVDNNNIGRRQFLRKAAGVAAGAIAFPYIVPSSALGKAGAVAPSNRVIVGCIGVGGQGSGVMQNFLNQDIAQVVAVCDVKANRRQSAKNRVDGHYGNNSCTEYHDFRELLARDDIDAVMIASTDHWHVLHALAAARAGKGIYLEKPMGLSLAEDQALREACHRYGTVFQFGTQQRSDWKFRFACELALNQRVGKVHTINVLSPSSVAGGSMKPAPVPEWLDYDFWLGPAPYKPYTEDRCSNKLWWQTNSGGSIRITPSAGLLAGVFIPWTSFFGVEAKTSPVRWNSKAPGPSPPMDSVTPPLTGASCSNTIAA